MEIAPTTTVHDLIRSHPELLDFLSNYRPELSKLKNPLMRETVGRVATLERAAELAGVPVDQLLADLRAEVGRDRDDNRLTALKQIILDLHHGLDFAEAQRRFGELVRDVDYGEIAAMEQRLLAEGLPESEIKRLCDVHVALFKESLEKPQAGPTPAEAPPGHPIHTFRAENAALTDVIEEMRGILAGLPSTPGQESAAERDGRMAKLRTLAGRLSEVDRHYLRKENQLFPALERRGFEGPTKVMWAIHDDVRDELKAFRAALDRSAPAALKETGERLLTAIADLIYKEERILFPSALDLLDERDWVRIRQGEDDVGYALGVRPGDEWRHSEVAQDGSEIVKGRHEAGRGMPLDTGLLTVEQLNLLLRGLPVDVTFVDEHDEVRYYSEGERVFPRSPGIIGRKVQNCHPPGSVHVVQKILDEFRAGTKDRAEFWLTLGGRFVYIRYFALRDKEKEYRGTLEVVQDVTGIRELTGERRLLEW